jgi:hypothetical protein
MSRFDAFKTSSKTFYGLYLGAISVADISDKYGKRINSRALDHKGAPLETKRIKMVQQANATRRADTYVQSTDSLETVVRKNGWSHATKEGSNMIYIKQKQSYTSKTMKKSGNKNKKKWVVPGNETKLLYSYFRIEA